MLNSELEELSERIESAVRVVRGTRPVAPVLVSAARTDGEVLRKDLHWVHALVERLVRRFPVANLPANVPAPQ